MRVHIFAFGARLTDVARELATRDAAASLGATAKRVEDWSAGTRIGACPGAFKRGRGRRLPGQGMIVILVTGGNPGTEMVIVPQTDLAHPL